ncbi:hypothetical protein LINPERPRIM_LOCUS12177, partial [Linum perenne]
SPPRSTYLHHSPSIRPEGSPCFSDRFRRFIGILRWSRMRSATPIASRSSSSTLARGAQSSGPRIISELKIPDLQGFTSKNPQRS